MPRAGTHISALIVERFSMDVKGLPEALGSRSFSRGGRGIRGRSSGADELGVMCPASGPSGVGFQVVVVTRGIFAGCARWDTLASLPF